MEPGTLHPLIVHFPIAGLIMAALLDLGALLVRRPDLSAAALYVQAIAAAGAVAAYLSGDAAEEHAEHALEGAPLAHAVLERHEDLAKIVMVAAVAVVVARGVLTYKAWADGAGAKAAVAALSLGLALAVGATGYFGGQLVYEHGVGVARPPIAEPADR